MRSRDDETSSGAVGVALAFVSVKLQLVKGGDRPCSHSVLDTTDKEIVLEKKPHNQWQPKWRSAASSLDKLAVFLLKHVPHSYASCSYAWAGMGCRLNDILC